MYQFISRLLEPSTALLLSLGVLLLLATICSRWNKGKRLSIAVCYFALWASFTPVCAYFAVGSLEWGYPPLQDVPSEAEAIVVLSAYVRQAEPHVPFAELDSHSMHRCLRASELYHQRRLPIVVSGGTLSDSPNAISVAEAMAEFLKSLGVRSEDLIIEKNSKSTYENAAFAAVALHERSLTRMLLVSDATHLWRAERCFAAQGLTVIPAGCNYRARRLEGSPLELFPSASAAASTANAVHEWIGYAWYYLSGRFHSTANSNG